MQKVSKRKIAWIILPLAIIAIVILISNPILKSVLERELDKRIDGLVQYHYSDLKVDLFSRSIHFEHISWEIMKEKDTLQLGKAAAFELKGIAILPLIFKERKLSINRIAILQPEIHIYHSIKDSSKKTAISPYDIIEDNLQSLSVDHFDIEAGAISWYSKEKTISSSLKAVDVEIDEIFLDSSTSKKYEGWFSMKQYTLSIGQAMGIMNKGLHKMVAGPIFLDENENLLQIDSFGIVPLYPKNELAGVYGYQTNWMSASSEKILIEGFRFDQLIYHKKMLAGKASILGLKYSAFREKAYEYHPERYTTLPQLAFKKLGIKVKVDSVLIPNAYLEYEEHQPPANENGKIYFSNANIYLSNLSNDSSEDAIGMHAEARVMGEALLKVDFTFPLNNSNGEHHVEGELSQMQLNVLNPVFEPLAFFSIRSGFLSSIHFNFSADNESSSGEVQFAYENLKIKLIEKEELEKSNLFKDIASFFANHLLINSDNSNDSEDDSRVDAEAIAYKRNTQKSILNYWWKSLFSGMQSTAIRLESLVSTEEQNAKKEENVKKE